MEAVRVFKFLPSGYGLVAIQDRRLKISTFESTNDPFEFLPFDLSRRGYRWAVEQARKRLGNGNGMICFSGDWRSPVIWAHYAEGHGGMCLEFELADFIDTRTGGEPFGRPVNYIQHPFPFDDPPTGETYERMVYTKFADWSYEKEVRVWTTATDKDGDHYYMGFGHNLVLHRVLLGVGCPLAEAEIDRAVGPYASPVAIEKVRRSYNKFQMEIDEGRDNFEDYDRLSSFLDEGAQVMYPRVGRNDPCPCGSGKKFKKCHGQ